MQYSFHLLLISFSSHSTCPLLLSLPFHLVPKLCPKTFLVVQEVFLQSFTKFHSLLNLTIPHHVTCHPFCFRYTFFASSLPPLLCLFLLQIKPRCSTMLSSSLFHITSFKHIHVASILLPFTNFCFPHFVVHSCMILQCPLFCLHSVTYLSS